MTQSDLNATYKLVAVLISELKAVNSALIEGENDLSPLQVLDFTTKKANSYLKERDSNHKRTRMITSNPLYVPPKEVGIGTRFELERDENSAIPQRIQSTFQYVSIVDTIKSLFLRPEFKSIYFNYNSAVDTNEHKCADDVYERFCCGSMYANSTFFQADKNRLVIQIATDEFEPCEALQSKAGSHKILAVYFVIRNMPSRFLSKLQNIYLICLCNSNDVKTEQTDYNNIWNLIAEDIKYLEETGIDVDKNTNVKGTLAYMSFDNLGANSSFGMVESFRAFFYCRICELPREECEKSTREHPNMLRKKEQYMKQLAIIEKSETVNLSVTKGIKRLCALNEIENFHIMENISVDILHDLNEGVIPFLLRSLFNHCVQMRVFNRNQVVKLIQFYDFGYLNSKNRPSKIELDSSNLRQNGAQLRCLLLHLPFILSSFKKNLILADIWICVKSLLKICQIAYSPKITNSDLITLENEVHVHLENVKRCFKVNLTPKHHFLTHYCTVIRLMGPVVHMSMMRFEAKHKYFKNCVKRSCNYVNINKTLALKHQKLMCEQDNGYKDEPVTGAKKGFSEVFFELHSEIFASKNIDANDICEVGWLQSNGKRFKAGLFILTGSVVAEIIKIVDVKNNFHFFCVEYDKMGFDTYSNSYEIKQSLPIRNILVNFTELLHKISFERKRCDEKLYIIADTLDIKNILL